MTSNGACVVNIGPNQRRMRRNFGAVMAVVAVALAAWLVLAGAGPLLRVSVFFLAWPAALGFLQYREKT